MVFFIYFQIFNRTFCKQTVEILIRHRIMRCLIWDCSVCLCPIKRTVNDHLKIKCMILCFQCSVCILIDKWVIQKPSAFVFGKIMQLWHHLFMWRHPRHAFLFLLKLQWIGQNCEVKFKLKKQVSMIRKYHNQTLSEDQPTASWGRATDHWLSQNIRKTDKVKQLALSSPSRWLQTRRTQSTE